MGFLKDFKRDFAQAVNELMPEIPISGYVMEKILKNKPKRASHARAKKQ